MTKQREILFRGKRVDNGKWVYGSLFHDPDIGFSSIMGFEYSYSESGPEREEADYKVDPATVGQYTGLTDKNGRKIFEGDIIFVNDYCRYVVKFSIERMGFIPFANGDGCGCCEIDTVYPKYQRIEIIGNTYDSPDLAGGAEHE